MKRIMVFLLTATVVFFPSCGRNAKPTEVPEDFSFSIGWGVGAYSTYDSKTGILIKQTIAKEVEKYTTTLLFSDEQKAEIFFLLYDMKPAKYPDIYNPIIPLRRIMPFEDMILSVTYNGKTKTISCKELPIGYPKGKKGLRFITVFESIVDLLEASEEWKSLPDYEFLYI